MRLLHTQLTPLIFSPHLPNGLGSESYCHHFQFIQRETEAQRGDVAGQSHSTSVVESGWEPTSSASWARAPGPCPRLLAAYAHGRSRATFWAERPCPQACEGDTCGCRQEAEQTEGSASRRGPEEDGDLQVPKIHFSTKTTLTLGDQTCLPP